MRGWAMRVKAASHGQYAEVGCTPPLKHIRIRVRKSGTSMGSVAFSLEEAKLLRRFLSRAIRSIAETGKAAR